MRKIKMRKITKIGIGAATVVAAAGTSLMAAPAAHASGTYEGCPYGAVCIYPANKGWNGGHPESGGVFWSRGAHNLSNQYGVHRVFNNQYGGWYATLNKGYNGRYPVFRINQYYYTDYNLTPINSISLVP